MAAKIYSNNSVIVFKVFNLIFPERSIAKPPMNKHKSSLAVSIYFVSNLSLFKRNL